MKQFRLIFSIILIAAIAASNPLWAAKLTPKQLKAIVPSDTRAVIDLGGTWDRIVDGASGETISLPFSESSDSKVVYQRTVNISREMLSNNVWHMYFLGVDHEIELYFNEQFVGRYFGGMSPLKVRIPDKFISPGNNTIMLKLAPPQSAARQIRNQYLFAKKVYTGVIRDIFLMGTPKVWISDIKYSTALTSGYSGCNISTKINISSGNLESLITNLKRSDSTFFGSNKIGLTLEATVIDNATGITIARSESQGITIESERTTQHKINFNCSGFNLWSPDRPDLYELKVAIFRNGQKIDELASNIGFRDLFIGKSGGKESLILNGHAIDIKAVDYIEDHIASLQSLSFWRMEEDIKMIKTLGANVIRVRYTAAHPYLVDLCDRYGLFMMVELPLYDVPSSILALDEIKVIMSNLAKQYTLNYDNHPSVFAWGISEGLNERSPVTAKYTNEIIALFKASSSKFIYKIVQLGQKKLFLDNIDLVGIECSNSTDINGIAAKIERIKTELANKPFFLAYGYPIQPYNHNGYSDPLSIEYQAYGISSLFKLARSSGAAGSVVSTFNDYELNNPLLICNNEDIYLGSRGLVDRSRRPRLSYNMLQSLFNNEREPLLNAGSYVEQTPLTFIIFGIALLVAFLFLANRYRRFREYLFRSLLRPYNFYADIRDQRIISSVQTLMLALLISFTVGIFVASTLYYYRSSLLAQYILMFGLPSNGLREFFYRLVWMPEIMMIMMSAITLLGILFMSVFLRFIAFLFRARIYFNDTLAIATWSSIPAIGLLPFSIVLIRIYVLSEASIVLFTIGFIALKIWILFRIFRSSAVVFDKRPLYVYLMGALLLVLIAGIPLAIYQLKYSIFAYMEYFFKVMLF